MRFFVATVCAVALVGLAHVTGPGTQTASAQAWAREMFEITDHDFGTVARGAKTEFDFKLVNKYVEDLHIASVRASCGCTTPQILTPDLKTWETGTIRAIFNTKTFTGDRKATITVVIDRPFYAEVQLHVKGFIRGDVVIEPGTVNFGSVAAGQVREQRVRVDYSGRSDWRITDVRSGNEHFEVQLNGPNILVPNRVQYDMLVRLKGTAPAGHLQDQLTIVTNDRSGQFIPLEVGGTIDSPVTVKPESIYLGTLKPGDTVSKNIVVRGAKPFRITAINGDEVKSFNFRTDDQARPVHLIPFTFTASQTSGSLSGTFTVVTENGDAAKVVYTATIEPVERPVENTAAVTAVTP